MILLFVLDSGKELGRNSGCAGDDASSSLMHAPQNGSTTYMMRHGRKVPRLGRPADQRKALVRSLTTEFFRHGEIRTTKVPTFWTPPPPCSCVSGLASSRHKLCPDLSQRRLGASLSNPPAPLNAEWKAHRCQPSFQEGSGMGSHVSSATSSAQSCCPFLTFRILISSSRSHSRDQWTSCISDIAFGVSIVD